MEIRISEPRRRDATMSGSRTSLVNRIKTLLGRKPPEPTLRESIAELLTDEGYTVVQAANGKEAHDLMLQW